MQIIKNNPYRIVGLLVGTTTKEQIKQINRLKMYIEAEQNPNDDFSFSALGELHRTINNVNEAESKLNLNHDRMSAALFWFYNGNSITDIPAFNLISEGKISDSAVIWRNLTKHNTIEKRNASAFQNLSTLLLNYFNNNGNIEAGSFKEQIRIDLELLNSIFGEESMILDSLQNEEINEYLFKEGIRLKLKFIESDFMQEFISLTADNTYRQTKQTLQLLFLSQLLSDISDKNIISTYKSLIIINDQEFIAKEEFITTFVKSTIEQIDKKIKEARIKWNTNKADAIIAGKNLFLQTTSSLLQLSLFLKQTEIKLSSIYDKLSNEVLQCGIEYFNFFRDSKIDPSVESMELFKKAESLSRGNITKQRCQENTNGIQEWINDKPLRQKQNSVNNELEYLDGRLQIFQNSNSSVNDIESFVLACKHKLDIIRETIGKNDNIYINISNAIVQQAQHKLITRINAELEDATKKHASIFGYSSSISIVTSLEKAFEITFILEDFAMYDNLREQFKQNIHGLKVLMKQNGLSTLSPSERREENIEKIKDEIETIKKVIQAGEDEIWNIENILNNTERNTVRLKSDLNTWQLFRTKSEKRKEIAKLQSEIDKIYSQKNDRINQLKQEIKQNKNKVNILLKEKLALEVHIN
jgi:hypothetical protein